MESAAKEGFHPSDELACFSSWMDGLNACENADLVFVDMIATLRESNKIAGYEEFAVAKMKHPVAQATPLVLIAPEPSYELDFMAGWPNFVFGHVQRPVTFKIFRRASTWV